MIAQSSHEKLTLRQGYEYLKPDHKPKTVESYLSLINHWEAAALSVVLPEKGALHLRIEAIDPDLHEVDNITLIDFKNYLKTKAKLRPKSKKRGLAQNTVRKYLKHLAAILNRLGPADHRNKEGLGILPAVPFAKPPAEILKKVKPVRDDEVVALYEAAEQATWPRCEVPPMLWWRSLIVFLYNIGLRRMDYLSARQREFDLQRGFVRFDAEKTEKEDEFPLHPVVIAHLEQIWDPARVLVWPWRFDQSAPEPIDKKKTSLYAQWHRLRMAAGIARKIVPHDLRKTCGSGLYAISPAAACEVLQHSSIVTTMRSYANCSRETAALMLNRAQPSAFAPSDPDPSSPMILKFPSAG